jgi:pimeloyl-ACP methyl ester carboxylesterase
VFACGLPKARPNIHERLTARAEAIAREGIAHWGPKVSPGVFAGRTLKEMPEVTGLFERLFEEQKGPEYVREIEVLLQADLNAVVPRVTAPCIAIAGREDSYAPPAAVEEFIARLPGACPLEVLENCAHMPFLEDPAAFAAAVERFLATLRA